MLSPPSPTTLSLPDTHQSRQHVHLTLFEGESEKTSKLKKSPLVCLHRVGLDRAWRAAIHQTRSRARANVMMDRGQVRGLSRRGRGLSCGPALGKADSLDRWTVALVQAGPAHAKGRVEVGPVLIALAALAAQAVGW